MMTTQQLTEAIDRLLAAHGPICPLGRVMSASLKDILDIAIHSYPEGMTARALVGKLEGDLGTPLGEWLAGTIPADDANDICRERAIKAFPESRDKEEADHPMGDDAELFWWACNDDFPIVPDVGEYRSE